MQSVECKVWVWNLEFRVRSVKCIVWSVECKVQSVECSVECEV